MIKLAISISRRANMMRLGTAQEERPVTSSQLHHMVSERKRREKLNESFDALRMLLPPGSKKDKASVLAKTRDYLSTLKSQISELEKKNKILEGQLSPPIIEANDAGNQIEVVQVKISKFSESTSEIQQMSIRVTVCVECDMISFVLNILECLKAMSAITMKSVDASAYSLKQQIISQATLSIQVKGADIPEAVLPEPFNRRSHIVPENASLEGSIVEVPLQASLDSVLLSRASHFPSSFRTQFSQKVIVPERRLTQLLAHPPSLVSIGAQSEGKESSKSYLTKENICSVSAVKSPDEAIRHGHISQKITVPETQLTQVGSDNVGGELSKCLMTEKLRSVTAVKLPDKAIRHHMTSQFLECTPVKSESNAAELMLGTPVLQTPHRPIPTLMRSRLVKSHHLDLCQPLQLGGP